jgi:hypothetical protein
MTPGLAHRSSQHSFGEYTSTSSRPQGGIARRLGLRYTLANKRDGHASVTCPHLGGQRAAHKASREGLFTGSGGMIESLVALGIVLLSLGIAIAFVTLLVGGWLKLAQILDRQTPTS